ncbi:hypothetical protein ES703_105469 [subsurface metagenome]
MSIKNNWKDKKGYIYLIFSIEELASLLEIDRKAVMRYKKLLVDYRLIIDKRLGQGRPNMIYVLKPELQDSQKYQKGTSRSPKMVLPEVHNRDANDTYTNETNLNNVNRASSEEVVENSEEEIKEIVAENEEDINDIRRKIKEFLKENRKCNFTEPRDAGKENKPLEIHTDPKNKYFKNRGVEEHPRIKRYRSREKELLAKEIAEELEDDQIRIFLSIIKDTHLTGKIKKNRGAMFISLAKAYAVKNNINLNFR